jgi:superfamily I DNA/RNA helicase
MTRSKKDPRVVLIGDYDQSIYNFRGTDLAYIQDFISKYEGK